MITVTLDEARNTSILVTKSHPLEIYWLEIRTEKDGYDSKFINYRANRHKERTTNNILWDREHLPAVRLGQEYWGGILKGKKMERIDGRALWHTWSQAKDNFPQNSWQQKTNTDKNLFAVHWTLQGIIRIINENMWRYASGTIRGQHVLPRQNISIHHALLKVAIGETSTIGTI